MGRKNSEQTWKTLKSQNKKIYAFVLILLNLHQLWRICKINFMLVCSIPIKTFDINKDGRVLNQPVINFQQKVQQKRPIRNFNYLKMVMSNRSKELKNESAVENIKSRTTSIETYRKTLSEFNPEAFLESLGTPSKQNKKTHRKTQSHHF